MEVTRYSVYVFLLGFAQNKGPCAEASKAAVEKYGLGMASPHSEAGTIQLHTDLESLIAEFLSKEDCMIFGMGFITNAGNIPSLLGKGCLLLSDELNHASIVLGAKLSGAKVQSFLHNDMTDFEKKLRKVSGLTHCVTSVQLMFAFPFVGCDRGTAQVTETLEEDNSYRGGHLQHGGYHLIHSRADCFEA